MSRITRAAVLTAALFSSLAAMTSSAAAVTWSSDGDTAFTATSGPFTFSTSSVALSCTSGHETGTMNASTMAATWAAVTNGTALFNGCPVAGVSTPWHCAYTVTLTSGVVGGVSSSVLDMTCGIYQFNTKVCEVGGPLTGSYTNPSGAGAGKIATNTGGHLRAGAGCANFLGGPNVSFHLSPMTWTVVSGATKGPIITHA